MASLAATVSETLMATGFTIAHVSTYQPLLIPAGFVGVSGIAYAAGLKPLLAVATGGVVTIGGLLGFTFYMIHQKEKKRRATAESITPSNVAVVPPK